MRGFLLFLIICCGICQLRAQYLWKREQRRDYASPFFDGQFGKQPLASFELKDVHLYKKKKVKKILVYSNDSILLQATELDSSGKIVKEGTFDGQYFRVSCSSGANPKKTAYSYYLQNRLMRTDTNVNTNFEYKNGDTMMQFHRSERFVYRSGELLNKQNRYYNNSYFRKRIRVNREGSNVTYVNRWGWKRHYVTFLKKRFPTNFDSLKIYLASSSIEQGSFYARKSRVTLDTAAIKTHPFFKRYRPIQKTTIHVAGQNFQEPYFGYSNDGWSCGFSNRWRDYPTFEKLEWTYNDKGLQDTYLSLYYPQDTSKAAIARYKEEKEKAIQAGATFQEGMDGFYPRKKTPIVRRIYFVRYEYFE